MAGRLNPRIKTLWLEALRSGRYAQARGALCVEDEAGRCFCCLGVLTDLAVKEGVGEWSHSTDFGYMEVVPWVDGGSRGETIYLPDAVRQWAGGLSATPSVACEGVQTPLSALNDGTTTHSNRCYSFAEIADFIERQY